MAVAYPNKTLKPHVYASGLIWRYGRKMFMEHWFKNLPRMYKGKKNLAHWANSWRPSSRPYPSLKTKRLMFGKNGPKGPNFDSFHLYSHNTAFLLFFCYFGFLNHDYIIENTLLERRIKNKLKELQNG